MQIKEKIVGALEWAVLNAALSVLVFFIERRLNKSLKKRQAGPGTTRAAR